MLYIYIHTTHITLLRVFNMPTQTKPVTRRRKQPSPSRPRSHKSKRSPSTSKTQFEQQIDKDISNTFPAFVPSKVKLEDFYVIAPSLPFYEKDASGKMVKQSEKAGVQNGKDANGESVFAKKGESFTGSIDHQVFVDLGMNTYLPLNDMETGQILLRTKEPS